MEVNLEELVTQNEKFLEQLQTQKAYAPGTLRVVLLDANPVLSTASASAKEDGAWQFSALSDQSFSEALLSTRKIVFNPNGYPKLFQKK